MALLTWLGIGLCLVHAGIFSGLTIGLFGLSRLRLETMAATNNAGASRILSLREDAHFLLVTLLWGNVSVNVLLTLLMQSMLTGLGAFVLSTVALTLLGEIIPQAYFSRNAMRVGAALVPLVRFYSMLLYPLAKPTAWFLDRWLGKEGTHYFQEEELTAMLRLQAVSGLSDVGAMESTGATNFLALDDVKIEEEGELIDPRSILALPIASGRSAFPTYTRDRDDPFLQKVRSSGKKWVIITDPEGAPRWVMNASRFLREALYGEPVAPPAYCYQPVVVTAPNLTLGEVIFKLQVRAEHSGDDVIDCDVILYWGKSKRIITGSDLLGRLMRGIVPVVDGSRDAFGESRRARRA